MKFAIVAHGYSGATLPLANHLAKGGHDVTCYYFCWYGAHTMESLDFGMKLKDLTVINKDNNVYHYLDSRVDIVITPVHNQKSKKSWIKKIAANVINKLRLHRLIHDIESKHFDLVNVLLYTDFDFYVLKSLYKDGVRCCQTYHEVLNVLTDNVKLMSVVEDAVQFDTPIILHSEKTKADLLANCYLKNLHERIRIIHFGKFESYLQYGDGKCIDGVVPQSLLYLGFIKPYKGLGCLYEASRHLPTDFPVKIIVAGGGYDEALDKMRQDNRFVVINRFVDNDELVWMVKNCKAIVCPYLAASQSGLVQTAMVYDKPIIATKVGAFTELIHDGKNGCLVNVNDAKDLSKVILRFFNEGFCYEIPCLKELDWPYIASQYTSLLTES